MSLKEFKHYYIFTNKPALPGNHPADCKICPIIKQFGQGISKYMTNNTTMRICHSISSEPISPKYSSRDNKNCGVCIMFSMHVKMGLIDYIRYTDECVWKSIEMIHHSGKNIHYYQYVMPATEDC